MPSTPIVRSFGELDADAAGRKVWEGSRVFFFQAGRQGSHPSKKTYSVMSLSKLVPATLGQSSKTTLFFKCQELHQPENALARGQISNSSSCICTYQLAGIPSASM